MRIALTIAWITLLVTVIFFNKSIGQIHPNSTIVANDLFFIQEEKEEISKTLDRSLSQYQLLAINQEQLQELLVEKRAYLELTIPDLANNVLHLQLEKSNLSNKGIFPIRTSSGLQQNGLPGIHYKGQIAGLPESVVAFSIFEEEIMAIISAPEIGNLTLGKMEANKEEKALHVLYSEKAKRWPEPFYCETSDEGEGYSESELMPSISLRSSAECVKLYLEVDYDIYLSKGSLVRTVSFIAGLFNQVATLYTNEQINLAISEVFIWDHPSPYNSANSNGLLEQFQNTRTNFPGDLAQLISYRGSGGIAVLNGICHPFTSAKMSFASIRSTYATVPNYSWSVMVMAHEIGHQLGSRHTHACVWNGNNTAIDGCAGITEGGCDLPPIPVGGGTLMSYCHLTQEGVNFSRGFGIQPGNIMRNRIAGASCLSDCSSTPSEEEETHTEPTGNCTENTVRFELVLDHFGPETTWELRDVTNEVLYSGGPYAKKLGGRALTKIFCLPNDCYTFLIKDNDGDGICCDYGQGAFQLVAPNNQLLAQGGNFGNGETVPFCLPNTEQEGSCLTINFEDYLIGAFGANQDQGQYEILDEGNTLKIEGNAWKAIALDYEVTSQTVLAFDFASTIQGDIHGLGFDDNNTLSYSKTLRLYGTQNWGLPDYANYPGDGEWKSYVIPFADLYQGSFNRLFFVADHDTAPRNGNSFFRNVRIYEGQTCEELPEPLVGGVSRGEASITLFPNPVGKELNMITQHFENGPAQIQLLNVHGQIVQSQTLEMTSSATSLPLNVSGLIPGTYLLKVSNNKEEVTKVFNKIEN